MSKKERSKKIAPESEYVQPEGQVPSEIGKAAAIQVEEMTWS